MMQRLTLFLIMVLTTAAFTQDLPKIAVYVAGGDVHFNEKNALGTRILSALIKSGRYRGIERSTAFLAEVEKEQAKQRSGDVDDGQISALGKMFGVQYVCIAAIVPVFGANQVSARIVDVETAEVILIGEAFAPQRMMVEDFTKVSDKVVEAMLGKQQARPGKPSPALEHKFYERPSFWMGLGLEIAAAGIAAYGIYENSNVAGHDKKQVFSKAEQSAKNRNIAYIVGASVLAAGVSVHIFF